MRKVLWLVDGDKSALLNAANYIRAQVLCIRTTNSWLQGSIGSLKSQGFDVYAWRWPNAKPIDPDPKHLYAMNEAQFVTGLIDAGLDGYIVDPECDKQGQDNCWNSASLAPLANQFCDAIKLYGRNKNPNFLFGTTSGGQYPKSFPKIPWSAFVAHSDALYPQCYWYADGTSQNGGTPQKSYTKCTTSWKTIAPASMRIVPIIGAITEVKASDISAYQEIISTNGLSELHFYTYEKAITQDRLDAMRALGTSAPAVA